MAALSRATGQEVTSRLKRLLGISAAGGTASLAPAVGHAGPAPTGAVGQDDAAWDGPVWDGTVWDGTVWAAEGRGTPPTVIAGKPRASAPAKDTAANISQLFSADLRGNLSLSPLEAMATPLRFGRSSGAVFRWLTHEEAAFGCSYVFWSRLLSKPGLKRAQKREPRPEVRPKTTESRSGTTKRA